MMNFAWKFVLPLTLVNLMSCRVVAIPGDGWRPVGLLFGDSAAGLCGDGPGGMRSEHSAEEIPLCGVRFGDEHCLPIRGGPDRAAGLAAVLLKIPCIARLAVTVAFAGWRSFSCSLTRSLLALRRFLVYIGAGSYPGGLRDSAHPRSERQRWGLQQKLAGGLVIGRGSFCGGWAGRCFRARAFCHMKRPRHGDGFTDWQCADGPLCAARWRLWRCC